MQCFCIIEMIKKGVQQLYSIHTFILQVQKVRKQTNWIERVINYWNRWPFGSVCIQFS